MGLEEFIEYCRKNSHKETKDKNPKREEFILDLVGNPRIAGAQNTAENFTNVILYEKGRFGGRAEKGVVDLVFINNSGSVYICMAKVCNRAGRRVRKRLNYARNYVKNNFNIEANLISARKYRGKICSRIISGETERVLRS